MQHQGRFLPATPDMHMHVSLSAVVKVLYAYASLHFHTSLAVSTLQTPNQESMSNVCCIIMTGGSHLWAAGTLGSSWGHMSHTPLQPSQSLYDPFSQTQGHALPYPRLQGLAQDHALTQAQSQSPEGEPWYRVPYEEPAKPASVRQAGLHAAGQHQHSRSVSEQAMQPQVAVRDSNIDFDVDMGWSDDDAAPPLPAESPPGHVSPHLLIN